jgi:zinc protease
MLNRTFAPEFNAIDHIDLIVPGHIKFDNDCNLYWFSSGEQELVRIEWIFNNLRFDPSKPLLNVAANTMIIEGTGKFTAAEIADAIDYYGAFLQVDYNFDHAQVTLYCLNKHLHHTLPVIKDIITEAAYPESELQTFIRNQQQKLQVSLEKNDFVARRAFNKALFGNTMYGISPTEADYGNLKQQDILEYYRQMYQPGNCTIIIAGKVGDEILKAVTTYFGDEWQNTSKADITQPHFTPGNEHFIYVEKPDAIQSAIRMGSRVINRNHPDFPALQVVNTIFGGYFGSRLMANIREEKGYTYGIGSAMTSMKYSGSLFIATEVGTDVTGETMIEIENEMNLLKTELISDEELSLVKNYMLGSLLGSLENVFSHADKFKNIYASRMSLDYYTRYTDVVRNIQPAEISKLANQYLDFDKFYKVIVGKYEPRG